MPFDNRHAPLNAPHLTGEATSTVPGVNEDNNRIATMQNVQALARRPFPGNPPIQLLGDVDGRGTAVVPVKVTGWRGLPLSLNVPSDTEVYVWNQAAYAWLLVPACLLGQQSDGNGCQAGDGTGGFVSIPTMSGDGLWNLTTGVLTVIGLQGRHLAATAPADAQILTWNQSAGQWEPRDPAGGSGGGGPDTVERNVVAAGITQAGATPITAQFTEVTGVPVPGASVQLPAGSPGDIRKVRNSGANPMQLWPRNGDGARIDNQVPDQPIIVTEDITVSLEAVGSDRWYTLR